MLTLQAVILNVFGTKASTFTDKKTGEIKKADSGHKVQLQWDEQTPDGDKKLVLKDFNVHGQGEAYKKAVGKRISVNVGFYNSEQTGRPELYIPRNALPTVLS